MGRFPAARVTACITSIDKIPATCVLLAWVKPDQPDISNFCLTCVAPVSSWRAGLKRHWCDMVLPVQSKAQFAAEYCQSAAREECSSGPL